jgi:hypothetical protein
MVTESKQTILKSVIQNYTLKQCTFPIHLSSVMEIMGDSKISIDYEVVGKENDLAVKIILLGDSAVGKSK